ncbi:hypothetical protein AS203_01790 [Hoylesella enoeca]|uniref:Uncharacterized protein n=1 Tax=Hoylesella enoeca TaxID=76123 RepID=A0A0S2KI29_9BACT|nr:hypothetical protein AS203_01790 [Hoylesella enoeca]
MIGMFWMILKMSFRPGGNVAESHLDKFPRAESSFFSFLSFPPGRKRCFFHFQLFRPGGSVIFPLGELSAAAEAPFFLIFRLS